MNEMNIFQRMSKATAMIRTVKKKLTVTTGGGKGYNAVSEKDILDAVKPIEEQCGIYSYPISREILESHLLDSESTYTDKSGNQTVTTKTTFMTRIKTVYRFVNIDKPTEYIETTTFAEGIDSQDKGSGKAMTYGDKYALMKAYKISTGDEPEHEVIKEKRYVKQAENYVCVDCGKELEKSKIGEKIYSAAQLADYTEKKYGKILCPECASRMKWVMENADNQGNTTV